MCRVVTLYGIYQRHITHKPVFINMTAKMHEFVRNVDSGGGTHIQPSNVGCEHVIEEQRPGNRYQNNYDQRIRWEECNTPIIGISEAHFDVSLMDRFSSSSGKASRKGREVFGGSGNWGR